MNEDSTTPSVIVNFPEFITGTYDFDILTQLQILTNRFELFLLLMIFNTVLFMYFIFRSVKKNG